MLTLIQLAAVGFNMLATVTIGGVEHKAPRVGAPFETLVECTDKIEQAKLTIVMTLVKYGVPLASIEKVEVVCKNAQEISARIEGWDNKDTGV